jgi:hypothetical protein
LSKGYLSLPVYIKTTSIPSNASHPESFRKQNMKFAIAAVTFFLFARMSLAAALPQPPYVEWFKEDLGESDGSPAEIADGTK